MSKKNLLVLTIIVSTRASDESPSDLSEDLSNLPVVTVFQDGESYHLASGINHLERVLAERCRYLGTESVDLVRLAVEVKNGTEMEARLYGCCDGGNRSRRRKSKLLTRTESDRCGNSESFGLF